MYFVRTRKIIHKLLNTHNRVTNFVMLHSGRCGSTVAGDLLAQHPEIAWRGEIFERYKDDPRSKGAKLLDLLELEIYAQRTKIWGFATKFLSNQQLGENFLNMPLTKYIQILENLAFDKYVVYIDKIFSDKQYLRRVIFKRCNGMPKVLPRNITFT